MTKSEKKFLIYAMLAVTVLMFLVLGIINVVNFTIAAEDADRLTSALASQNGSFSRTGGKKSGAETGNMPGGMGPWQSGPSDPDTRNSLRYFTVSVSPKGDKATLEEYHISAISESYALEIGKKLANEKTGWVNWIYRYRVYENDANTYVVVIDQARELGSAYRTLVISAVGFAVAILLSFIFLKFVACKRIFEPLKEADRKQKQFVSNAESELKLPLTIISANNELMEKKYGPSEQSESTSKQLKKVNRLIKKLDTLSVFEEKEENTHKMELSGLLRERIERKAERYAAQNIVIDTDIDSGISIEADPEAVKKALDELVDNQVKFSLSKAFVKLKRENDRVVLTFSNDTDLAPGSVDNVFDRFTTLENAGGPENSGIGLSYVKDVITSYGGRVKARVASGDFIVSIYF